MTHWEYLAAIIALGAGLWPHVRAIGQWLRGFVVAVTWIERDVANPLTAYLTRQGTHQAREPRYGLSTYYVRPLQRNQSVAFESLVESGGMFWHKRRPLWLSKKTEDKNDQYEYKVAYIRGTVDWEDLLAEVASWNSGNESRCNEVRHKVVYHHGKTLGSEIVEQRNEKEKKYVVVWGRANGLRPLRWRPEDIGGSALKASFDALALSPELVDLAREMRRWHESQEWYQEHRITWRRGYAFVGDPGTGKTSFARAAAEEFDLPVHVFDLASMSNEDLRDAWTEMLRDGPCMALIEDLDAVFHGRENISTGGGMMSSGGLTFDTLLNCIDGIERADGVLFILTTNHLEHLDPALTDRPGRIDRVVPFQEIDHAGRLKIARQILGEGPEARRVADMSDNMPASKFVEVCCARVLASRFGEDSKGTSPAERELRKEVIS